MGRLTPYLTGTCNYAAVTSHNQYGEKVYSTAVSKPCRKEGCNLTVTSIEGKVIVCNTIYYMEYNASMHIGDKLDDHEIAQVDTWTGLSGELIGMKCYV